jgi:DNA-binding LacI/PurR family transcriptional regulator
MIEPLTKPAKAAEEIRDWISQGKYQVGAKLPSILQMSKILKIADKSVRKAISQLSSEGLLVRENGVGIFVCSEKKQQEKVILIISNPSVLKNTAYYDFLKRDIYCGVKDELTARNSELEIYPLYEPIDIRKFMALYNSGQYKGVITVGELYDTMPGQIAKMIGEHKIISANYGSSVSRRNEILVNAKPGVLKALQKAYELGHRKFAMIYADTLTQRTQMERFTAFIEFCNEKNISVPASCMLKTEKSKLAGYRATNDILEKNPATTLIFACNDHRAEGVLQALKDCGLTPGKEVSVIGYDNTERAKDLDLATVKVPRYETGQHAVRLLHKCLNQKLNNQCIWLKTEPVFRGSLDTPIKKEKNSD